jgi:uncharacterized membrane protein YccC
LITEFGLVSLELCAQRVDSALDLDHVGWPTAAALLVMRPVKEMQQLRSIGRPILVCLGALVAIGLIEIGASEAALAAATALAVMAATATVGSRWYITPLFTTLLVFLLMLYGAPQQASGRFWERITETLAGVAVAYFFGFLVPNFHACIGGNSAERTEIAPAS